jgi:hypothetical protein
MERRLWGTMRLENEICSSFVNPAYELSFSQEFWEEHDTRLQKWEEEHGVILKAPTGSKQFNCSNGVTEFLHVYPNYTDTLDNYSIGANGSLLGTDVTYMDKAEVHKGNWAWANDQFCVTYADLTNKDYNYVFDEQMDLSYATCYNPDFKRTCEDDNSCEKWDPCDSNEVNCRVFTP